MSYIELINVEKTFHLNNQNICALNDISLSIEKGDLVSLMGRSGSGKSTLMNIIAGLISFENGNFLFEGKDMSCASNKERLLHRRKNIGMIVQNYALLEDETVFNNIALPLKLRKTLKNTISHTVKEMLDNFNLEEKRDIPVCKLSGGQKQRVAIARAMCHNPQVLLADEPTAALDAVSEQEIMKWFLKINNQGTTIILVTHNHEIAAQSKKIITLVDGQINI